MGLIWSKFLKVTLVVGKKKEKEKVTLVTGKGRTEKRRVCT